MSAKASLRRLLLLVAVAALAVGGIATSGASFVAGTSHTETFSTGDWTPPVLSISAPSDGALTNVRATPIAGVAGTLAGDQATVTVRLYAGPLASGSPLQTLSTSRNAGTGAWSVTAAALPDGVYTVRAAQDDAAGNTGLSSSVTFTVDGTAPAPTITAPTAGQRTDGTPQLSGAAGNASGDAGDVIVRIYTGGTATGTPVRTLTVPRTGAAWTAEALPALTSGTYTARATQADAAGNSGQSAAVSFVVDATAPSPTIRVPAANASLATGSPVISGRASTGATDSTTITVKLYGGASATGAPVRTLTTTRTGNAWTLTTAPPLPDGQYTAQAEQADSVGNVGLSATRTFRIDTAAPSLVISAPTDGQRVGARPAFSGTAGIALGDSATVTVRVYSGAVVSGPVVRTLTATRNATTGAWAVTTPAPGFADGQYTARATQLDAAGNSGTSPDITFTVDAVAPAPTITAPAAGALVGATPIISGAAGDALGDAATLTVRIYAGATATGTAVRTLTATRTGAPWAVTVTPALTSGTYTATAAQADGVGNTGTSPPVTFTVDATPPAGLTIAVPAASAWLATDRPTFSGQAGNAANDQTTVVLKVYAGATATGTPVQVLSADRTGTAWTLTPAPMAALADGQYTAQLEQLDTVGNLGRSAARTFRVDTTAPVPVISTPVNGARVVARPPTTGTAGIALGDGTTVALRIYAGATATGTPVQTVNATRNAAGAWSVTPATLAAGTYTLRAFQVDSAGNTGGSAPVTVTVDTVRPTAQAIAATNGGGVAGRLDAGDAITFTYSEALDPATILAGWNGTSIAMRVRFFSGGANDTFSLLDAAGAATVRIAGGGTTSGGVSTGADLVSAQVTFAATMQLSADGRTVTVTLGTPDTPSAVRAGPAPARNMAWSVNTAARDLAGNQVNGGTVTETDNDRDF